MPDFTNPLNIPYPNNADTLAAAVKAIPKLQAEKINDLIAALSAVAPVAPFAVTLTSGWVGSVFLARRAGISVCVINVTKASYGVGEVIATLPVGHRPVLDVYFSGQYGDIRNLRVSTNGQIIVNNAGSGGFAGSVALPV